jgi:hypothetical protein
MNAMKTYRIIHCMIALLACLITLAKAAEPPAPAAVAGTVQGLWKAKKFPELERYISALNVEFPNYVPAILAESFYLQVYRGKLPAAKVLLVKVRQSCDAQPALYGEDFKNLLTYVEGSLNLAMDIAVRKGTSNAQEEAAASPEKIWEISKNMETKELGLLPDLQILSYAPKITLPDK